MNNHDLSLKIASPEVLKEILGAYNGGFSLGISGDSELTLSVEGSCVQEFPQSIRIEGEAVSIRVQRDFMRPSAL